MERLKNCPYCGSDKLRPNGTRQGGVHQYRCKGCGHYPTDKTKVQHTLNITPIQEPKPKKMGISESELRQRHDVRFQATKAAESLKDGTFLTQAEFVQLAKIRPGAGYRDVIEHTDYEKYRGKAGGTVYWGHPEGIRKLKEEGVLQ